MTSAELEWWNSFSEIANKQWLLSDTLNEIVRRDYLQELVSFLYVKDGKVLDIGCGPGWVGLLLARKGMSLTGVDFSEAQIEVARCEADNLGLDNATFIHGDITTVEDEGFDSVVIHATLHHLPDDEVDPLLVRLHKLMRDNGMLYLYEPLAPKRDFSLLQVVAATLFFFVYAPWYFLQWLAIRIRIGPPGFRQAVRRGWTGLSPNEQPLDKQLLLARLQMAGFSIEQEPKYWHAYSLAFSMGCAELGPLLSRIADTYVRLLWLLDRIILSSPLREHVLGVWTFVSILARKTSLPNRKSLSK